MIRTIDLTGGPVELGANHGKALFDDIQSHLAERMRLAGDGSWVGERIGRDRIIEEMELSLNAHERFDPDLFAECTAMAESAGISVGEAILLGGFTDAVDLLRSRVGEDDCTAVMTPSEATHGPLLAQTWDMHDTASAYIALLHIRPERGPAALVFTTAGCLGQIGMNTHGICVGINNLTAAEGTYGVSWPFVVRAALKMTNLSDVVDMITGTDLMGGHNYMVMDGAGHGYNIEAMPQRSVVDELRSRPLVHTNHSVHATTKAYEAVILTESMISSRGRYDRAGELLREEPSSIGALMELLRDEPMICRRSESPLNIQTCGAVVMNPADGELYACQGVPADVEFDKITL
ncbi:MAG: hypothetical protein GEU79_01075 [Acidimicrobiia bacterium]|nr:hypothetical protein [Acidimicrobiia bacterium]